MPAEIKANGSVHNKCRHLDLRNSYQLLIAARKGVKPKLFYDFAEVANMPEKSLAGIINLSARTISNYKDQHKTLEPIFGEHLLKLIRLFEKGETIFGSVDAFNYWLRKPFWNVNEKPIDWIVTSGWSRYDS